MGDMGFKVAAAYFSSLCSLFTNPFCLLAPFQKTLTDIAGLEDALGNMVAVTCLSPAFHYVSLPIHLALSKSEV